MMTTSKLFNDCKFPPLLVYKITLTRVRQNSNSDNLNMYQKIF